MFKKSTKRQPSKRFDVNQTLATGTYQPNARTRKQSTNSATFNDEAEPKKRKLFGPKRAILLIFILIITPLLVIGIWDLRNASRASEKVFGSGNIAGLLAPTPLDNDSGRTNIMLVGYSKDDPGHAGANLTDSILVVSMDKSKKSGFMLSVPRDLYVDIPNYGAAKINEAFQAGEQDGFSEAGYPAGGPGLLEKVVSDNFGIPIHYYILVDYGTVRDVVNAFDGVTVNVESPDPRGLYDPNFKPEEGGPLKLANGPQQIDGQTALRLTRARGSTFGSYGFPQSDFNRVQNQQKVFAAIKSELNLKLILDPRLNSDIFDAFASNVKTDLTISEMIPVYRLMTSVPDGSLQQINLTKVNDRNLLDSYQTRSGQSALVPAAGIDDYSEIQALIKQLSQ